MKNLSLENDLRVLQNLPLSKKVEISLLRIQQWYEIYHGDVHVLFSGGLDSLVLLHLVRSLYPKVPAVFNNTGLEFPEIVSFVKGFEDVVILRPALSFKQVLKKWGYPFPSKENAQKIYEARNTKSEKLRSIRLKGKGQSKAGKIPNKWKFLLDAPFQVSAKCCDILKKAPTHKLRSFPISGIRAEDSRLRFQSFIRHGCNAFDLRHPVSRPLIFWLRRDIWEFINAEKLPYCEVYDMGYKHTGCIWCGFGVYAERQPNRYQMLKRTHNHLWNYCIYKLGIGKILEFCGVPYY